MAARNGRDEGGGGYLVFVIVGMLGLLAGFGVMLYEPGGPAFTIAGLFVLVGGGALVMYGLYRYMASEKLPEPRILLPGTRPTSVTPAYVALALRRAGMRPEDFGFRPEV